MSVPVERGSRAPFDIGLAGVGLAPEELWDLHGTSLFAMACALLGDEAAALRAVTMGMMDLYIAPDDPPRQPPGEALRSAARCIYRRCHEMSPDDSVHWSMTVPPLMSWLGEVALFQRRTLALCVFGGHTYRDAAFTIDIPPGSVAQLLISGLRELNRLASTGTDLQPGASGAEVTSIDAAHALLEEATGILMLSHGLDENYAVEMLCCNASRAGSTVVQVAARVVAEAASGELASSRAPRMDQP